MSRIPEGNPRFPEDINRSDSHPLKEFLTLMLAVTAGLALLATVIGMLSQWLAPALPFAWEDTAAGFLDGAIDEQVEEGNFSVAQQQALQQLGDKLLRAERSLPDWDPQADDEIPDEAFSFQLLDADIANAFASLGAHILVTDELLRQLSSENALAMVLAHEISHVRHRDPIRSASGALLLQLSLSALLGEAGQGYLSQVLSATGLVTINGFSRDMEREADRHGLAILVAAYGHSLGADEFFRLVAESEGDNDLRWLEFTRTHPDTRERLESIARSIEQTVPDSNHPPPLTPMPKGLRMGEEAP